MERNMILVHPLTVHHSTLLLYFEQLLRLDKSTVRILAQDPPSTTRGSNIC